MGNSHSCTSFRGGFIGSGCNPSTGHTDPQPSKPPPPPPVKPFVQTSSSLALQGAQTNQFNTANMGARMNVPEHF